MTTPMELLAEQVVENLVSNHEEPGWITLPALIKAINVRLDGLNPEQRVELFLTLAAGFCRACGWERDELCHCENDE